MRYLVIMLLILSCSSSFAGLPWADTFESVQGSWSSTRTFESMLSDEYNATVQTSASQSLKLVSDSTGFNQETASRTAASTGNVFTTAIVSFYFYDDGKSYKNFRLGVEDSTSSGQEQLFIGVADGAPLGKTGKYIVSSASATTVTGITRSMGWHFTEIKTDATGSRIYLDGAELPEGFTPPLVNPEVVRLTAAPVLGATGIETAVWVDDVRFSPGRTRLISEQVGPWSDDVEGPQDVEWDTGFFGGNFQNGAYDHTNTEESSFSLRIATDGPVQGLQRLTELQYEEDSTGTLSFWFYDDGQTTNGYLLGAQVASFGAGEGKIRGSFIAVGVADGPTELLGEYLISKDNETTPTGFFRSVGWHFVEVSANSAGVRVLLDNQEFDGNFFPGFTRITSVLLLALNLGSETQVVSQVWVDDIKYERNVPTSTVNDWSVY